MTMTSFVNLSIHKKILKSLNINNDIARAYIHVSKQLFFDLQRSSLAASY